MKLIAFCGAMGSGKSTAIQYLKDTHLHKRIENIKFAGPLYDMQEYCYRRIQNTYTRPSNFVKDRKLLQWLGTDWGRGLNPNMWTDLWKSEVSYVVENYPKAIVVCDDVRFDNEATLVRQLGGVLVKIKSNKNQERIDTTSGLKNHSSESGIPDNKVDFVLDNEHTLEEFKNKLDELFKLITKE